MGLQKIDEGLWTVEAQLSLGGLQFPVRTVVARLAEGGLVLFSPIPGISELRAEIEALGPVRALVSQNLMHHLGLPEAQKTFPAAVVFARPGLSRKQPTISVGGLLTDEAPPLWASDFKQTVVQGASKVQEVAFLHLPTKTLLLGDLCFHVVKSPHALTRWFMRLNGAYGQLAASRLFRFFISDRDELRTSVDRILTWNFGRLIVSHGSIIERNAHEALARAFQFLR